MRLTFFLLILANLILFVWGQGYWGGNAAGREPERMRQQVDPDKLHILTGAAAKPPSCQRIEWLTAAEAATVKDAVAPLPGWAVAQTPRVEEPAHWAVIPELDSHALGEKKQGELRQLGVKDSEIVEDAALGPYVVSLGLFRSQPLAEEFMQSLTRKGVRSARLTRRELPPEKFALELRAPSRELDEKLPGVMAALTQAKIQAKLADCKGS